MGTVIQSMEKVVQGFAPSRRPWGLLVDVATAIPAAALSQSGVNRIGMGVTWVPWGCDGLRRGDVSCDVGWLVQQDNTPPEFLGTEAGYGDVDDGKQTAILPYEETVVQAPFKIVDGLACNSLSMDSDEMDGRLVRRMDVFMSSVLAAELQSGLASQGASLNDAAPIVPLFGGFDGVAAAIEQHLADTLHGAVGIVHIPPAVLHVAMEHGYVRVVDGMLRTSTGHAVSADAGLDPSAGPNPGGPGQFWLYATGPVGYHVTDTNLLGSLQDGQTFDYASNLLERIAEALGIVVFDPCSVAPILLDLSGS